MTRVKRSALVPYTAAQMFDLVLDVRAYPSFLPWCESVRVIEENDHQIIAELEIARGGLRGKFATKNRFERPGLMTLELVSGPFKSLSGSWKFDGLGEVGCRVEMELNFDFDNRVLAQTIGKLFGAVADKMVDAFCDRAESVYP